MIQDGTSAVTEPLSIYDQYQMVIINFVDGETLLYSEADDFWIMYNENRLIITHHDGEGNALWRKNFNFANIDDFTIYERMSKEEIDEFKVGLIEEDDDDDEFELMDEDDDDDDTDIGLTRDKLVQQLKDDGYVIA